MPFLKRKMLVFSGPVKERASRAVARNGDQYREFVAVVVRHFDMRVRTFARYLRIRNDAQNPAVLASAGIPPVSELEMTALMTRHDRTLFGRNWVVTAFRNRRNLLESSQPF